MGEIKIDANAFSKLFASFEETTADAVKAALREEATRLLNEASARQPMTIYGVGTPYNQGALPMRQRSDGVWEFDATRYR